MEGMLYLVATPIGNMEDITFRAVRVLNDVDLIAAEDTRNSIRLLNHYDIHTKMTSYHEYNRYDKAVYLVNRMREGDRVALITDAGTPGISDPGEELVKQCIEAGIPVTSLPGACAGITALTISGLSTRRFIFEGFLPYEKKERAKILSSLKDETRTMIFYEAPHHLKKTVSELAEVFGNRTITVCRELTKRYETVQKTSLYDLISYYNEKEPRGEYVLILAGRDPKEIQKEKELIWQEMPLKDHMDLYLEKGMTRKDAMKAVAKDRGVSKRDIYQQLCNDSDRDTD